MNRIPILIFALFISIILKSQTAVNFTASDCNGTVHDLFTELDEGKVIVLCWVMPCPTCVPASKSTYNKVAEFQATQPGKVYFYLCDDYGTTICSTVESWANSNGITSASFMSVFSDSTIKMLDYGSTGMPKIVVLGGSSHTVFYNVNSTVDVSELGNSINQALAASSADNLINETVIFQIFPNPSSEMITIVLDDMSNIRITDISGRRITEKLCNSGNNFIDISDLPSGIYIAEIDNGLNVLRKKFTKN